MTLRVVATTFLSVDAGMLNPDLAAFGGRPCPHPPLSNGYPIITGSRQDNSAAGLRLCC